jgi:hypothetical protein
MMASTFITQHVWRQQVESRRINRKIDVKNGSPACSQQQAVRKFFAGASACFPPGAPGNETLFSTAKSS